MRYLLDTCVISDFIKGESGTKDSLSEPRPLTLQFRQLQSWSYVTD